MGLAVLPQAVPIALELARSIRLRLSSTAD
jgi:hypothetical protein